VKRLDKKSPAFYETRNFITAFTSACHLSMFWVQDNYRRQLIITVTFVQQKHWYSKMNFNSGLSNCRQVKLNLDRPHLRIRIKTSRHALDTSFVWQKIQRDTTWRLRLSALQTSHYHKHVQGKTRMNVSQCFMHHAMKRRTEWRYVFLSRCSPIRSQAASLLTLLDHTQP